MWKASVRCCGNGSVSPNQFAIAASYAAVTANACAASRRRSPSGTRPSARSASSTGSYWSGRDTGTTWAKFFAAARRSAGPPTSIISIASASLAPRRPATEANG